MPNSEPGRITFATVRKIGREMPDVEEGTAYGSPALKLRGKLLACIAIHKSAEPNTLAVRVGFEERSQLMAADPDTFYLKDHYVNYPIVLARLSRIRLNALCDLLDMGWRYVNAQTTRGRRPRGRSRRPPQ